MLGLSLTCVVAKRTVFLQIEDIAMKIICSPLFAVFTLVLVISGCVRHEERLPLDAITALRTTFNTGDATAAAELFTDDGAMLPRFGTPVKGKEAIKQYMDQTLRRQQQFWIDSETSTVSGDLAYDEGTYRIRDIRRDADLDAGKYVNIFKRENGVWKIYRSIFSSNSSKSLSDVLSEPPANQ